MTERDYTAWLAVRIVGEAVTRTSQNNPDALRPTFYPTIRQSPASRARA